MYFSLFPVLPYDVNGDGRVSLVTNLMKRVRVRANVKKELALLQRYPIQDGESPEMVADKHFGHTHYHWIIYCLMVLQTLIMTGQSLKEKCNYI